MKEIKFWTCFGMTLVLGWAIVALLMDLGLQPFNIYGVVAIVAYALLATATLYSVIEEISR